MIDYDFYKDHISCYKSPSFIEKEVNGRLLERLEFINISPNSILELGSGHGYGVKLLQERFPSASLYAQDFNKEALNYMLENKILGKNFIFDYNFNDGLPFKDNKFDLVVANLSIQAADNIYKLLKSIDSILSKDGIFIFSLLAEDSLSEFRDSWASCDSFQHVNPPISTQAMSDLLQASPLTDIVIDCENIILEYSNIKHALKDIRNINEPLALIKMRRTLTGKNRWLKFANSWTNKHQSGKILNTFQIMYGFACKNRSIDLEKNQDIKINIKDIIKNKNN